MASENNINNNINNRNYNNHIFGEYQRKFQKFYSILNENNTKKISYSVGNNEESFLHYLKQDYDNDNEINNYNIDKNEFRDI